MTDTAKQHIHDQARADHVPIIKDDGLQFLLAWLREHENVRDILECGTAVGWSAMNMASVRWDMRIDTLEVDPEMYRQATANIEAQGYSDRIFVHLGDAAQFQTDRIYDLVFVDAAKSQYRRYLEHFYRKTFKGS